MDVLRGQRAVLWTNFLFLKGLAMAPSLCGKRYPFPFRNLGGHDELFFHNDFHLRKGLRVAFGSVI